MASEIKSDKLSPSGGTALQIGDASDTITIPTGATFTVTDGLGVASGGTGLTGFTAGDVLYATGTTTLAKLAKGTAEQVLAMNSGATAPDWGSVDITVLPTITVAKGGTNLSSFTAGDILYATGSTTLAKLGKGTGLQGLQTNSGATAPEWVNSPQSLMTAAGDVLYASGANTLAKLAKGSDDDVLTLASGVPSWAEPAGGGTSWQAVVTGTTKTAVAGEGYFIDTTSNVCNVTLPAGVLGDEVSLVDYAGTFDSNTLTVTPDSGERIQGESADTTLTSSVERSAFTLVYSGATQGWLLKNN